MIEAMQAWLPDPSQPLSPLLVGLGTVLAILILGGALSLLARDSADLVTEGALPVRPFIDRAGGPVSIRHWAPAARDEDYRQYPHDAVAMALSAVGSTGRDARVEDAPPGCAGTEIKVRVPYGRDVTRAMTVVLEGCRSCEGVLEEPASSVRVAGLADSCIELVARAWFDGAASVASDEDLRMAVAGELNEAGFDIPLEDIEVSS